MNSRLDTIQAAILIEKLRIFPEEIELREKVAERYSSAFRQSNRLTIPRLALGARSVWAQYTLLVNERARLQAALKADGIPTNVYYPTPLNAQPAYRQFPGVETPVSTALAPRVLSLPMHPYLDEATQDRIIASVLQHAV